MGWQFLRRTAKHRRYQYDVKPRGKRHRASMQRLENLRRSTLNEPKKRGRKPSVRSPTNDTNLLAEPLENQSLSEKERIEFDKLLDWITYDSDEAMDLLPENEHEEISVTVRQIQEKIYWRKEGPSKGDLVKLRKIMEKAEHALKTT